MRADEVDERTSSWEEHGPVFRAFIHRGVELPYTTATFDLSGCDVLQAIDWAQRAAAGPDQHWALALVRRDERGDSTGLIWLVGMDGNDDPQTDRERDLHGRMRSIPGTRVGIHPDDRWPDAPSEGRLPGTGGP